MLPPSIQTLPSTAYYLLIFIIIVLALAILNALTRNGPFSSFQPQGKVCSCCSGLLDLFPYLALFNCWWKPRVGEGYCHGTCPSRCARLYSSTYRKYPKTGYLGHSSMIFSLSFFLVIQIECEKIGRSTCDLWCRRFNFSHRNSSRVGSCYSTATSYAAYLYFLLYRGCNAWFISALFRSASCFRHAMELSSRFIYDPCFFA